jgi:hypothetical protein
MAKYINMGISIVVARYNENVDWTKQFTNVIIYNKGNTLNNDFNQVMLKNVGREGHTYYKYIIDNYDNLDDYTVFVQGNPFDHSPNIINDLLKYINNKELSIDFEYLSKLIKDCNLAGCKAHCGLPLISVYERLFNERKTNMEFKFGCGAQFIVSKKNILKRPISFYSKIVQLLEDKIHPIEGFVIERFHKLILG